MIAKMGRQAPAMLLALQDPVSQLPLALGAYDVGPLIPRAFDRLSRIYLGIHGSFDKIAGIEQGNQVADWVFTRVYVRR